LKQKVTGFEIDLKRSDSENSAATASSSLRTDPLDLAASAFSLFWYSLEIISQSSGIIPLNSQVALMSGWSKAGKTYL
jgi:hypothetical protein